MLWLLLVSSFAHARQQYPVNPKDLSTNTNNNSSNKNHFWDGTVVTYSDSMRSISSVTGDSLWFYDAEPNIQRITESTQIKAIRAPLLVEFFAPWCPHCQHFRDDFIATTRKLQKQRPTLAVAAVDCVAFDDICNDFDINGFPTLRLFNVLPRPLEFKGNFKAGALTDWVLSMVQDKGLPTINEADISGKNKKRRRVTKKQTVTTTDYIVQQALHPTPQPMLPVNGGRDTDNIIITADTIKSTNTDQVIISSIDDKQIASSPTIRKHTIKNIVKKRQQSKRNTTQNANLQQQSGKSIDKKEDRNMTTTLAIYGPSVIRNTIGRVQMPDMVSAVVFWLHHNIFIGADKLTGMRLAAFKQILASLQLFFFQVCAGTEETDVSGLFHSLQFIDDALPEAGIDKTEWAPLLRESGLSAVLTWTNQCKTSSSSFTCGLWLLFHAMLGHSENSEQATAACQSIVAIIRSFFGCDACRNHFLTMVPDLNDRAISRDDAMMWLWRSHNSVNQRLDQNERIEMGASTKAQRPSDVECSTCQMTDGTDGWDLNVVTEWLLNTYGPPPICNSFAPNISSANSLSSSIGAPSYTVFLLFLCGVALAVIVPAYSSSIQRSFFSKRRTSPTPRNRRLGRFDV